MMIPIIAVVIGVLVFLIRTRESKSSELTRPKPSSTPKEKKWLHTMIDKLKNDNSWKSSVGCLAGYILLLVFIAFLWPDFWKWWFHDHPSLFWFTQCAIVIAIFLNAIKAYGHSMLITLFILVLVFAYTREGWNGLTEKVNSKTSRTAVSTATQIPVYKDSDMLITRDWSDLIFVDSNYAGWDPADKNMAFQILVNESQTQDVRSENDPEWEDLKIKDVETLRIRIHPKESRAFTRITIGYR